jgi:hypothetical protein
LRGLSDVGSIRSDTTVFFLGLVRVNDRAIALLRCFFILRSGSNISDNKNRDSVVSSMLLASRLAYTYLRTSMTKRAYLDLAPLQRRRAGSILVIFIIFMRTLLAGGPSFNGVDERRASMEDAPYGEASGYGSCECQV